VGFPENKVFVLNVIVRAEVALWHMKMAKDWMMMIKAEMTED
jgi:hypothetical protein